MTKLHDLAELGQAIWLDYIQRSYIESGELQKLVDIGLRGMTSNPTIFEKAIAGSDGYDDQIADLAGRGKNTQEIYEALAIADIRLAADQLRPVYESSAGADGYVSLEVNPELARDTQGTLSEARRLWSQVERPNLMIKIPATQEGLPAISQAIAGRDQCQCDPYLLAGTVRSGDGGVFGGSRSPSPGWWSSRADRLSRLILCFPPGQ